MSDREKPMINSNPSLQRYYSKLESRIGYRLFLGGTRHYGYYEPGAKWPFPVSAALRRMEDHLFGMLKLQPGAKVLDAGCGVGQVAMRFASKGLQVHGIDVVENHVRWAQQNVKAQGFDKLVMISLMDYHHLEKFSDESFDGVYTMETLVHATDPEKALKEFSRVIKPGGSIALHEYDHPDYENLHEDVPKELVKSVNKVDKEAAMPGHGSFNEGVLQSMLEKVGFQDLQVEDLSENVRPMIMLFFYVAYVPFLIIWFLGLQAWFPNTHAGFLGYYLGKWGLARYVAVTGRKPSTKDSHSHDIQGRKIA